MKQFRYKYGDQPLEGYTIQRAVGYGGFGEVYYAISDSGRQVALKEIQNYEQIELRGISQCMNLKSPHLVTIFDIKYNKENRPFVIMEYVSGLSLQELLKESPNGLGTQKAAFFLREIAKGLSFLHECGIVHRDLKPGNIFYENGYAKIGDYGLTKAISASQHSGQTITVGTVHYMAPEIGAGCYDRSIDIYALGILLYEMLTGQVPFYGASPGEILMKHMSATPKLDNIEEPFAGVIRKALAKDPADRYQSVQEMVEDVFGSENIRNSVSQFSPESLSVIAERVAQKVNSPQQTAPNSNNTGKSEEPWSEFGKEMGRFGHRIGEIGLEMARSFTGKSYKKAKQVHFHTAVADQLTKSQRRTLAFISMAVVSLGIGILGSRRSDEWIDLAILSYLMIAGTSIGILLTRWRLLPNLEKTSLRNWSAAGVGIVIAALLSLIMWGAVSGRLQNQAGGTFLSLAVLCFVDWWRLSSPSRTQRVSIDSSIWIGAIGFAASAVFEGNPVLVIGVIAGTMLVVQVLSPFNINSTVVVKPPPVPIANALVSPFKRVWALLFSGGMFMGVCGIQRFYVGKIGTGILWLLTWGLFGIGQFIDIILILMGRFKDRYGRRLLMWDNEKTINTTRAESNNQTKNKTQTGPSSQIIMMPSAFGQFNPFGFLLSCIGYIFLLIAILIGLAIALRLPGLIAAGFPDPGAAQELNKLFGYTGWPHLLERMGIIAVAIFLLLAGIFIIIARRRSGPFHIIRAILGMSILLIALGFFSDSMPSNYPQEAIDMLNNNQPGPALELLLSITGKEEALTALIFVAISVIVLAWPPRQKQPVLQTVVPNQEVST
jgi:serine/threonine protein kinase